MMGMAMLKEGGYRILDELPVLCAKIEGAISLVEQCSVLKPKGTASVKTPVTSVDLMNAIALSKFKNFEPPGEAYLLYAQKVLWEDIEMSQISGIGKHLSDDGDAGTPGLHAVPSEEYPDYLIRLVESSISKVIEHQLTKHLFPMAEEFHKTVCGPPFNNDKLRLSAPTIRLEGG